ncbi:hypothetical protein LNO78_29080 [Klebsiella pneumoniae subsp. pneumoniae]|nr:hypothetical protein [Klebsiella pneumoniae subsp. pneumoniae]
MIEGLIARIKAFVMTASAVIAVLGAYILGGRAARRSAEIKNQREENKRLSTTIEVKNGND